MNFLLYLLPSGCPGRLGKEILTSKRNFNIN